eukprot:59092-Pyramimonas_sp.AAC.1
MAPSGGIRCSRFGFWGRLRAGRYHWTLCTLFISALSAVSRAAFCGGCCSRTPGRSLENRK